jgi:hypothetical protein
MSLYFVCCPLSVGVHSFIVITEERNFEVFFFLLKKRTV